MKLFHISDVLTATTGRLVSHRHVDGIYAIYGFLTGEEGLFTHQLPRVARECKPWLDAQFPRLTEKALEKQIAEMDAAIKDAPKTREAIGLIVAKFVENVRVAEGLPEMIPVVEMGEGMHAHIDPITEAEAMTRGATIVIDNSATGETK